MDNLFLILMLACIGGLIIGLKNPRKVIRWGENRTRLRVILYYGLGVIIFFILFGITTPNTDNASTTTTSSEPSKTVQSKQETKGITNKTSSNSNEQKTKENDVKKAEAEKAFKSFETVSKQYDTVYKDFNSVIKQLSDGSLDAVTAYNDLDTIKSNALTVFGNVGDLSVPQRYSDSKDNFQTGVAELRSSVADVQKYLDDNKTSTLANATNELKLAQQATQTANIAIVTQVIQDGYIPPSTKSKSLKK